MDKKDKNFKKGIEFIFEDLERLSKITENQHKQIGDMVKILKNHEIELEQLRSKDNV